MTGKVAGERGWTMSSKSVALWLVAGALGMVGVGVWAEGGVTTGKRSAPEIFTQWPFFHGVDFFMRFRGWRRRGRGGGASGGGFRGRMVLGERG